MKQNCDYSNLFIPDAIRIWNSLSQQLIDCSNVELFRDGIPEKLTQLCHAKISIILLMVKFYIIRFC